MSIVSHFIVNEYHYSYEVSGPGGHESLNRIKSAIFTDDELPSYIEKKVVQYSKDLELEVSPKDSSILAKKIIELRYIRTTETTKEEEGETTILEIIKCNLNDEIDDSCELLNFDESISLVKMIENLYDESANPYVSVFEFRVRTEGYDPKLSLGDIRLVSTGTYTEAVLPLIIEDKIIQYSRNIGKITVSKSQARSAVEKIIQVGAMTWQSFLDKSKIETLFMIIKPCKVNKIIEILDRSVINPLKDIKPAYIKDLLEKQVQEPTDLSDDSDS